MTDNTEQEVLASISLSKVLTAILETLKEVRVPTLSFLETDDLNKEIVMEYDETGPSFVFKLKGKDENRQSTE